jgi:tRNA threonylcarbamoyladenosine biosynthesis protein TsaE
MWMALSETRTATRRVMLADPAATAALAAEFAASLEPGDVVALSGDLGAGKTEFARSLIRARGRAAGVDIGHVPSPTFTLVQVYDLPDGTIYHFDLYRLASADEVWELGIEDAFAEGVSLIEWAERIDDFLPDRTIRIRFTFGAGETVRIAHIAVPE